jgi:hypothetical protein
MNNERERMWNVPVVVSLRNYPRVCLEGLGLQRYSKPYTDIFDE